MKKIMVNLQKQSNESDYDNNQKIYASMARIYDNKKVLVYILVIFHNRPIGF